MEDNNYGNYSPDILECIAYLSNVKFIQSQNFYNELNSEIKHKNDVKENKRTKI